MQLLLMDLCSRQMCWQGRGGEHGFLWGRTLVTARQDTALVTFRGESGGMEQLVDGYHARGTLEGWIDGVRDVAAYPKVLLSLYAAFVPPMLRIYRCTNFTSDMSARTSVGKSTVLTVAASVVGNPDIRTENAIVHTWNSTRVFVERLCAVSTDMPVLLDDTKQVRKADVVGEILYDFA